MEGAQSAQSRPYWIRYLVTFWAGEKLKWARDNLLIACVCSLVPGLIAAGMSAALSDDKWHAAANATLLTYGGVFVLFLGWRLIATPLELDREQQRFIDGLTKRLTYAKFNLSVLKAATPSIEVEILELHVQADTLAPHAPDLPLGCDIFLRVKLTARQTQPIEALEYELTLVLHGNSIRADYANDIEDWGLVTEKKPVGIGTTFHYKATRLTKLAHKLEQGGVPVEGWLHFRVNAVDQKEIGTTVYRLTVLTPHGATSVDIRGETPAAVECTEFQKISYAAHGQLSAAPFFRN
jgi:hypothetical protein